MIQEVQFTNYNENQEFIDSDAAATILGINKNNLRQIVHRKKLVPQGRQKRKCYFSVADVVALKTHRDKSPVGNPSS